MAENNNNNKQQNKRQSRYRNDTPSEFEEKIIQISRVSKKTKGGNQIGFSVLAVVGDGKGRVGVGLGKGPNVASSIRKGFSVAKQNMVTINLVDGTIPHRIDHKFGASRIMLKPAGPGVGVIAGGAVRSVVEVAGIKNVVGKILGTNNKITNVYCTVEALKTLKAASVTESESKKSA